jgi:drug/metabolite transporter (DMT)-like permease
MFILPTWFILSILTGLTSNGFNYLNRLLLRDGDDGTAYAWYMQILRVAAFGTLALFDWHIILTPYSIFLFALLGLTEFIGTFLYMKMHTYSDLSISSILSRTRLIWVPIIAFFLINENLNSNDYVGILVIFAGVSLTMAPKKLLADKGAIYANVSAFVIAINIVITKMLLPYSSNSVLMIALALPSIFLYPLFMKNAQQRIHTLFKTNILMKTFSIGLGLVSIYLFLAAIRFGEASKVNAVYQGMLIFSVIAGIIFLKERENIWRKLIGATITVVGVVLLSFS